jgi:hypothetical protein
VYFGRGECEPQVVKGKVVMIQLGKLLFILGAGSFVLNLFGLEFKLLMWIDLWGSTIGTIIRLSMIGSGAALFLIGFRLAATPRSVVTATAATSGEVPQNQA